MPDMVTVKGFTSTSRFTVTCRPAESRTSRVNRNVPGRSGMKVRISPDPVTGPPHRKV
jgi:hypothetical protein